MKKYILIALIIIVVVAAIGLVYYYLLFNSPPKPEVSPGSTIYYSDQEWGFELSYPSDWKKRDFHQREGAMTFIIDMAGAEFFVFAFNPRDDQVLENEMQNSIQQLQDAGILISQSKKTVAGYQAYELIYMDNAENPQAKQLHYFIDRKGDTWYQMLYSANQDKFNQYLPAVQEIISSFKITK